MSKNYLYSFFFLALVCMAPVGILSAQTLYGAQVDSDAAAARIFNATQHTIEDIQIASHALSVDMLELSAYHPIAPGIHFARIEDREIELIAHSNQYYTIVSSDEQLTIFSDVPHDNPLKAQIYLYNLLDARSCSLRAGDDDIVVFADIPAGESQQIAVNPVSSGFSLVVDDTVVTTIPSLPLKRGGSVSLFALQRDSGIALIVGEANIARR